MFNALINYFTNPFVLFILAMAILPFAGDILWWIAGEIEEDIELICDVFSNITVKPNKDSTKVTHHKGDCA